jgi:uncharacterized protein
MHRNRKLAVVVLFLAALIGGVTIVQAEPALWVVKGPHATVYLFGTVHVLKKDEPWRTEKIDKAIKQSGSLWLEIPNVDDPQSMQPIIMQLGLDQAHPLSTKLTKEQVDKLDKIAKSIGMPNGEGALEPLKPWLAAITLSVAPIMQAGYDPNSGVESVLKPEFDKAGKPVKGFETAEQQIHYFADLSDKAQVDYLTSELDDYDGAVDKFKKIVADWYAGDEKALDQMLSAELKAKHPDLFQLLVVKRNEGFVRQIQDLLKGTETAFVAIGAGHIVGSDGVPEILKKLGYKVEKE